jgi:opacity protein-like surface antigen
MRTFTASVTAAIVGLSLGATAKAADMRDRWAEPPEFVRTPAVAETLAGWYLRGDLGWRIHSVDRTVAADGFAAPIENRLDSGFFGGAGAGFKTLWGRVDMTADYGAPVSYRGSALTSGDTTAKVQASTVLFNVYYDIASWGAFTPYIGAGLGGAYVRTTDVVSTATPPFGPVASHGRWNVGWALMAGTSYHFSPRMLLDVGYRYLGLGDAETATGVGGRLTVKNLRAHELRIGLRWMYGSL